MSDLARFEDAFCRAAAGDDAALSPWGADAAVGLSVYRNTILKGAVDALVASHPTVALMVGETWLRAAAAEFARAHPPASPRLHAYGEGMADWLSAFPPAADTPYLPAMARLDGLWWSSYFAPEGPVVDPSVFAGLTPETVEHTRARLHPSVRLAAFDQGLASLWLAHQPSAPRQISYEISDDPEWIAFARPEREVRAQRLDAATFAYLSACASGESLVTAAEHALAADADAQFRDIIITGLDLGVFTRLDVGAREGTTP